MVQTFFHSGNFFKVLNKSFIAFNWSLLHVIFDFLRDKKKGKGTFFLGVFKLRYEHKGMGRNFLEAILIKMGLSNK